MKTIAVLVGLSLIVAGVCAIAWPFPLLTLNEPWLSWYEMNVLGLSESDLKPGAAGAALPFLWIVTAPAGVLMACCGIPMLAWGQSR